MTTPLFPADIDAFLAANTGRPIQEIEMDFWAEFDRQIDIRNPAQADKAEAEIKNVIKRLTP
jgi:hypothetical protein